MSYVPGYSGDDSVLAAELWRISQAFEETKLLQNSEAITVASGASPVIANLDRLGAASMYLAAASHKFTGAGVGFALYVLRVAKDGTMALTLLAQAGNVDFAIVANELEIVNNSASTLPMAYNLIRLL